MNLNRKSIEDSVLESVATSKRTNNKEFEKKIQKAIETKIKKFKENEERRLKIIHNIKVKQEKSAKNRSLILSEDIYRLKKSDHLAKLKIVKGEQEKVEEISKKEYEKLLQSMKEIEQLKVDEEKEYRKQ